jgi:hypothetical protein
MIKRNGQIEQMDITDYDILVDITFLSKKDGGRSVMPIIGNEDYTYRPTVYLSSDSTIAYCAAIVINKTRPKILPNIIIPLMQVMFVNPANIIPKIEIGYQIKFAEGPHIIAHGIIKKINDKYIDWKNSVEQQLNDTERLLNCSKIDIANLIPGKGKMTWPNVVEAIKRIGYPKNTTAIPGLLYLLQDINWPGALEGLELLSEMKKTDIQKPLEQALHQAFTETDDMWIAGLKMVVEKFQFEDTDFTGIDLKEVLSKSNW